MSPRFSLALALAAALCASFSPARAEAERAAHALGVGAGYGHYAVLDEAATSLPYGAHLVTGTLAYVGEGMRARWTLRLGTAFGHPEASNHPGRTIRFVEEEVDGSLDEVVVPLRGAFHLPGAAFVVERPIALGRVTLLVGGAARFDVYLVQGFARPGLMQIASLGPSVALRRRAGERQTLELAARTTLLGWATRMAYHQTVSLPGTSRYRGLVRQGSSVRTPDELQTVELEASYELGLGAHGAARAAFALDFVHDTIPRPLRAVASRLGLAVFYRF